MATRRRSPGGTGLFARAAVLARRLPALARRLRRIPWIVWAAVALLVLAGLNLAYQVARKPTELVALIPSARKAPDETWRAYEDLFREYSTPIVRAELLAALVQAESAGDPLALPPWRFHLTLDLRGVYAPSSSAVGILQMTDGNYARARELCIRDHAPAHAGAWYDPGACAFNGLHVRTVASHAVEMTAAWLHEQVSDILSRPGIRRPSLAERDRLAAVVHLCGPERGAAFARRGYRLTRGERCGQEDAAAYLARVELYTALFAARAAR